VGRVVDPDGAPIEGARVQVLKSGENVFRSFMRRMEGEAAVRTGKDGSFRATRLAPGENQRLDVRHDDFEERALGGISLAPGGTRTGLTVVMRRGLTLRGLVGTRPAGRSPAPRSSCRARARCAPAAAACRWR
jgi:hypothetical protein